jgi:hypothetical protein
MSHLLRLALLGRHPKVEVSAQDAAALRTAWAALFSLLQVEETWDCVVESYLELEQSQLSAALRSSVVGGESYHEIHDLRLGFARRLSNLLHACRAYVDQTPQRLNEIDDAAGRALFDTLRRRAHAQTFGYRLMDGLRNHAQHSGQPVHGAYFGSQWTNGREADSRLIFSVSATIDVSVLVDLPTINAKLRAELAGDLSRRDAPTMVRAYLEGLGSVQDGLRAHLAPRVAEWEATVLDAIERYAAENNGDVLGLALSEMADDGAVASNVALFRDMPDRLRRLARRNRSLVNLQKRVVTSEPGRTG